eukprot:g27770.t1
MSLTPTEFPFPLVPPSSRVVVITLLLLDDVFVWSVSPARLCLLRTFLPSRTTGTGQVGLCGAVGVKVMDVRQQQCLVGRQGRQYRSKYSSQGRHGREGPTPQAEPVAQPPSLKMVSPYLYRRHADPSSKKNKRTPTPQKDKQA